MGSGWMVRNPTLTKLKIQFVAASLSGVLRQVQFSVGCFGGSVLRLGGFVQGRFWPGRKLMLTVLLLWGKDSGGGQVRLVAC